MREAIHKEPLEFLESPKFPKLPSNQAQGNALKEKCVGVLRLSSQGLDEPGQKRFEAIFEGGCESGRGSTNLRNMLFSSFLRIISPILPDCGCVPRVWCDNPTLLK